MPKYKQLFLPSFRAERIIPDRKTIPHKRRGVIVRYRVKTKQRYTNPLGLMLVCRIEDCPACPNAILIFPDPLWGRSKL